MGRGKIEKENIRPASADGDRPSTSKFQRPCSIESSRPTSAELSKSSKQSSIDSSKKNLVLRDNSKTIAKKNLSTSKFQRLCLAEDSRPTTSELTQSPPLSRSTSIKGSKKKPLLRVKVRAFSASGSPKSSRESSPKGGLLESQRSNCPCPTSSPKSTNSSTSSTFKKWGEPYAQTNKSSTRSCSPDLTIVSLGESSKLSPKKTPKTRPHPSELQSGSNPATKRLMQVTLCAANARAPFPEVKAHKLIFYKNTDKENLIYELESLKAAVADQAYHLQLHKTHLLSLREEHNQLEEKVGTLESIDGSNAPRTGGKGRLLSKIAGMRTKISNLEDEVTKYQEKIQNLKYRYQVCLTREATIQRNLAAGDVWRLQKEARNAKDVLLILTKQNKKFLHYRNGILPDLKQSLKNKKEKIKEINVSIREVENLSTECKDETYGHKRAAKTAKSQATSLYNEGKKMRAKLKQERERKRKTQQDVWIIGYETCVLEKENRANDKRKKMKEASKVKISARIASKARGKEKNHNQQALI